MPNKEKTTFMEKKINNKRRKFQYLIVLTIIWVASELIFFYLADSDIEDPIIRFIFISVPLVFVYLGHKWAKWVTSIFLFLNGVLSIGIMLEGSSLLLAINSLFNLFFAYVLLFSKRIKIIFNGEEKTAELEKYELTEEEKEPFDYPYLLTRVKASFIDGVLLAIILIGLLAITSNQDNRLFVAMIFCVIAVLYEPILLTLNSATLGHTIMNIKVVNIKDRNKINMLQGFLRIITKFLLGWLSFLTINFNHKHRAIHDYISSSVVIKN